MTAGLTHCVLMCCVLMGCVAARVKLNPGALRQIARPAQQLNIAFSARASS